MAEDFNIRLSVDTSEALAELAKFKKAAASSVASTKAALSKIIDINDSFSTDKSISQVKKLTAEIVKLKKAAGDKGVKVLDSETSLAKVVESALKPTKAKGASANQIKQLQKELSRAVASPVSNVTEVKSLLETMRQVVSTLSRPNQKAAKDAADLRRQVDVLRKEYTILSRQINSGAGTPALTARKTQLESIIPKTQAKLAGAVAASKPSGDMKRMLETAQRGIIEGTQNLQYMLENLVSFADMLDETTTGAVSGAGQDLLSGNAVRSLSKNIQAATGGGINQQQLVRAVTNQVLAEIVIRPSKMSKPLSPAEQGMLQGRSSKRQYEKFGANAFTERDQTSSSGVMHNLIAAALQQMYPDRAKRGQGLAITFKGLEDTIAKLGKDSETPGYVETGTLSEIESLTETLVNGLDEMVKRDEGDQAAEYKGRTRRLSDAQASVKEAFGSMQTVEGNPDEDANRRELEAYVRGLLKDLSFGARGGKGGKRIGGTFVPTEWDKSEKTGGYIEGGYRAKDMNKGFFAVEEATAMQEGFQYATITAQEFADAMLIAIQAFGELQKAVPNPKQLVAYAGNKALSTTTPAPKLTEQQIAAWLEQNPQGYKPGVKLKAAEDVFGKNTISRTISAMIDAVSKKFMEPTGNVSEINSVVDLFEKLSPSMQNFIGLIEDFAIVEGKISSNFKSRPGEDETMGLNLSRPQMNSLEQLFSALNFNPSTTIGGHTYQGGNYPGIGVSASKLSIPVLEITKQLKNDFAAIFGGDMMVQGGKTTTVDPRTFRPSIKDDAIEMKAIDAFIENRRAFIDYIVKAGNRLVIDDITMGLPNVEKAFDKGSYTKFGGPGASDISYGELASRQQLYAQDPITTRGRAYQIFGGAKAKDAGINTVEGIRQGLANAKPTLAIESRVLADTVVEGYEDGMEIKSPSRRMARAGEQTVAGLFVGLKSGKVKLNEEGQKLAASFHSGYTEQERADAAKRVQNYEKMGLEVPAANLRAKMSTSRVAAGASAPGSDVISRNAASAALIRELAGVKDAIIAWDVESSIENGVFAYGMVGGTGAGDIKGIGHDMVLPEGFQLNSKEGDVLGLRGPEDLKKRIAAAGYDLNAKTDPQAQRKMIEDIMHLIQVALDNNIPIAMHNTQFSDFNSLQKMAAKYKISGAPAREARDKGLLIETQALGSMLGLGGQDAKGNNISMKNEDLYERLTGQRFGPQLIPKGGVARKYGDKAAVAHDPTIDAAGTLVVATEQFKRIKGTTQKVVGFLGEMIDTSTATVQDISSILFGWKRKTGKKTDGVALSYKGFDDSYTQKRPEQRTSAQPARSAAKAMANAQRDAAKAAVIASKYDRLTKEEREQQIKLDLDRVEKVKARLKALAFARTQGNSPEQNKAHAELVRLTQQELNALMPAGSPLQKEWNARLGVTGGVRSGFGGGGGNVPPVSASLADQNFEAEAKARSVASKKIQGQMKDEMSVMADVERYNRKMMDSWISGRYALYDMANTYQQFARAGMQVARFLKQAVLLNSQYETSFTGVERVMQPLNDEIAGMRNELVKLTTELPVAFDELSRISTLAGQMGINAAEITDFTKQVSQFGTVTGIATDEVASKFGSLAQLMHTATDPEAFQKLGSAVAYTGINAVATDQEILSLAESIASATTQAGFAADETIGLSTALSSLRIPPEQARGVITRLFGDINRAIEGGGKPLQAYAKQMGLTTEEAQKLWRSKPEAFFKKMLESVKNADNLTLALDALNIKETREVNTITRLSENMDVYNKSMKDAAEAYKNGTFLSEAYGKTQDNIATKITLLSNQFKLLQDAIGEALGPVVGPALDIIKAVLDGLTKISQNPIGVWAVRGITAMTGLVATFITLNMVQQKATASMLAFRTAGIALARMGGGESGLRGLRKQLMGQEVLIARSNGRIEVITKKRLKEMQKLGEVSIAKEGSSQARAILSNVDSRRGQLESTDDIILQKAALRQATLDETNQDRLSTIEKDKNSRSRWFKSKAAKAEAAAASAASGATAASVASNATSTASIEAEIVSRQRKISALALENAELQANLGTTPKEIASANARIAANNATTASIEREIVALRARRGAAAAGAGESVAVVTKQSQLGFGGIIGKVGIWASVLSLVVGLFAGINEAIEGTKVNLEEAGGGLASFREAIYQDTRAWTDGADAISTYDSKVTTSKSTLSDWAAGMSTATGATSALTGGLTTTTDEVIKQTLALGENSKAWLAKAAMSDTNVQDMFKKFYTVDGPGLGEMAEAAGTKISDIIIAALAKPGTGALEYVKDNFDAFADGLGNRGGEVKDSLIKIATSLDSTTAAGVESSKMVEALTEGIQSFDDGLEGAGDQLDTVTEKVRTLTDYTGDLSSILGSAFNIRYGKTEAIDKLTTAWKQLKDRIKQAREEMSKIQQEIAGMRADASILEYQLNIAIKYGDTKRADKLRADIAAKQQEIADKNKEMAKAQGDASTSLVGNSEAAVENRSVLRGLITDYNNYLAALANTAQFEGLSDTDAKKKKDYLKAQADKAKSDLITLATGLGFKENELAPYVKSFDDFETIINKLPKELTLKVVADPGTRAFMEWWAANKGNFNPTDGAPAGPTTTPAKPTTPVKPKKPSLSSAEDIAKAKVTPLTKAQKTSINAVSGETLVAQGQRAQKAFEDSRAALLKNFGTEDPTVATKKFGTDAAKLAKFNAAYAKYNAAKKTAMAWSNSGGTEAEESDLNIGFTEAGAKARAEALKKQPAIIQEAVKWLNAMSPEGNSYSNSQFGTDYKALKDTLKPFEDAKEDLGIDRGATWDQIKKMYPGNAKAHSKSQGKLVPAVATLTPVANKFFKAWGIIKDNVSRGINYRELIKSTYNFDQYGSLGLNNVIVDDLDANRINKKPGAGWTPWNVRNYASGGRVTGPGTGTSDSIAAMLSNGEFVMNAQAVRAYGPAFMNALNQQQLAPRYAMQAAAPQAAGAQIVYLSPEDRNLLRAAIDRPVNLYTENARIAQSANAGNVLLAQRGRN